MIFLLSFFLANPLQIFHQGAVVTDVAHCTSLGFDVLSKQGSSVDAAIAAALCLGIVHPHTSGLGRYSIEPLSSGIQWVFKCSDARCHFGSLCIFFYSFTLLL